MFLRNHGLVILGETIEEAFFRACNTVLACESQIRMMPVGLDNLIMISEDAKRRSQVEYYHDIKQADYKKKKMILSLIHRCRRWPKEPTNSLELDEIILH